MSAFIFGAAFRFSSCQTQVVCQELDSQHLPRRSSFTTITNARASYRVVSDDAKDPTISHVPTPSWTYNDQLGPDPKFLEDCQTCQNSGFVPCSKCEAKGYIRNPRSPNVFYCPDCVGHAKLRCPTCGGKCYMCE